MPRRISDYPDVYTCWNLICSWGSSISVVATVLFFYVVYDMFVSGVKGRKAPYVIPVLTQMQLIQCLLTRNISGISKKSVVISGLFCSIFSDAPRGWQLGFQDPATPIMEGIIDFHHDVMFVLIWIVTLVSYLLWNFIFPSVPSLAGNRTATILPEKVQHNTILEIIWTIVPCIILLFIAIPSFSLLYAVEDLGTVEHTIKVIANQWYWSYELPTSTFDKTFDSVMLLDSDLTTGFLRLLEVDARLMLPVETQLRLFITASDVLHSFAVPSLGVKMDACPGRLNQIALWIKREGVYYGQCSEICGVNHAFMPIVIACVGEEEYLRFLN